MPGTSLDREFLQNAILETLVPHAFDIDIEAALTSALEGGAEDIGSILSTIPQRSLLFFGKPISTLSSTVHLPLLIEGY